MVVAPFCPRPCSPVESSMRRTCVDRLARLMPNCRASSASGSGRRPSNHAKAKASRQPGFAVAQVVGIGVGGTGSSPLPVDAQNRALAMLLKWQKNLHAQCWLWKDHTSWREAARITELAAKHRPRGRALLRRDLPTGLREAHDKPRWVCTWGPAARCQSDWGERSAGTSRPYPWCRKV